MPEKPPAGQHYEKWFYADGKGDEKNALYRENAGDTKEAANVGDSKPPTAWHKHHGLLIAIDWLKNGRDQDTPFAHGSASILITPLMPLNPGHACMIRRGRSAKASHHSFEGDHGGTRRALTAEPVREKACRVQIL